MKKNEFVKAVIAGVLLGILLKIGTAESWFHIRESAWSQSLLFTAVYAVLLLIVFCKSFPLAGSRRNGLLPATEMSKKSRLKHPIIRILL